MAGKPSGHVLQQVHRLLHLGAFGSLSDAELLDRFVARSDEAAEQAFEELISRHGPMVLRVCRSVLRDTHDAEDAFQAVFLVLANRARSVRQGGSVASWLFGVAHRVATRGMRSAARRRALYRRVAERTSETYQPREEGAESEILLDEIERLPERLRAPLVLCYLQDLTYEAAGERLGVSATVIRGRLARARDRLRRRLTRAGVGVTAGLLVAGATGHVQASVPIWLLRSTTRLASGFLAGSAPATALAQGVLRAMLRKKLKVAMLVLGLSLAGGYGTWQALCAAAAVKEPPQAEHAVDPPSVFSVQAQEPPKPAYRVTGTVRLEGTGEPIPGARLDVLLGFSDSDFRARHQSSETGKDGRFSLGLPPGNARAWALRPPVGYWAPHNVESVESFVLSKDTPVYQKDFVVRRGTVWSLRFTRPDGSEPIRAAVTVINDGTMFESTTDDAALTYLTLPAEAGTVTAYVARELRTAVLVPITLEWEANFHPEAVRSVTKLDGTPPRYRLIDEGGKSATLSGTARGRVEPAIEDGKLIIQVSLPKLAPNELGDLTGKVINGVGEPIAGVSVALLRFEENGGGGISREEEHRAITDEQGNFRLRSIPRHQDSEKPLRLELVVTKDGFVGVDTDTITFQPPDGDAPQVIDPIKLKTGVSVSGIVVGPTGEPLAGAWVTPRWSIASQSQFTKTDEAGRFTLEHVPEGMVPLDFDYGKLMAGGKYLVARDGDPLTIQLSPKPSSADLKAQAEAAKEARPQALAVGTIAPEWDAGDWSDGRARKLADYKGKVVLLNFWGVWCEPCLQELPTLEKLRARYEPQGVVFLTLHTPGEADPTIRKILNMKKASLVFAIDRSREPNELVENGVTAARYGVSGYPAIVLIDREGKIAYHSGEPSNLPALQKIVEELGLESNSHPTEEQVSKVIERVLGEAIERTLNPPPR